MKDAAVSGCHSVWELKHHRLRPWPGSNGGALSCRPFKVPEFTLLFLSLFFNRLSLPFHLSLSLSPPLYLSFSSLSPPLYLSFSSLFLLLSPLHCSPPPLYYRPTLLK